MFLKILHVKIRILIFLVTLLLYITIVHQVTQQCLRYGRVVIGKYTCFKVKTKGYELFVPSCQIEANVYAETYSEIERLIFEVGLVVVHFTTEVIVGILLNLELVDIAVNAIAGIIHVIEADET